MSAFLENIKVGTNWRVVQIKGSDTTSFSTAYMTFKRPVIVEASPVSTLQVWISRQIPNNILFSYRIQKTQQQEP